MIDVFVEYTGQEGRRAGIPGGPFPTRRQAYMALIDFANRNFGSFRELIKVIDAYGFRIQGYGIVRNEVHAPMERPKGPLAQLRLNLAKASQLVGEPDVVQDFAKPT